MKNTPPSPPLNYTLSIKNGVVDCIEREHLVVTPFFSDDDGCCMSDQVFALFFLRAVSCSLLAAEQFLSLGSWWTVDREREAFSSVMLIVISANSSLLLRSSSP
jgi:hypothetical protein